jgi:hypothetical protein
MTERVKNELFAFLLIVIVFGILALGLVHTWDSELNAQTAFTEAND